MTLKDLGSDIDIGAGVAAVNKSYLWFPRQNNSI
jgi:hypothetical protein